jgi:hypothetical protein
MIETRDCIIVDTEEYGLVAILPIGMSQICSCNFEDSVKVGAKVNKGDPMVFSFWLKRHRNDIPKRSKSRDVMSYERNR